MTARADVLQIARKNAFIVPKAAVIQGENGYFVFKIAGDIVKKVPIDIGIEGDDVFEIRSGLSVGDQVVIKGFTGLRDGMAIRIDSEIPNGFENSPA
jgi:multidrug efflux pump subunit AcrA (membrane-fusion protein)